MPPGVEGEYHVHVIANSAGRTPVPADIERKGSNVGLLDRFAKYAFELLEGNIGSAAFPGVYREPDLKVTELNMPDTLAAGTKVTISFKEIGHASCRDRVCRNVERPVTTPS